MHAHSDHVFTVSSHLVSKEVRTTEHTVDSHCLCDSQALPSLLVCCRSALLLALRAYRFKVRRLTTFTLIPLEGRTAVSLTWNTTKGTLIEAKPLLATN